MKVENRATGLGGLGRSGPHHCGTKQYPNPIPWNPSLVGGMTFGSQNTGTSLEIQPAKFQLQAQGYALSHRNPDQTKYTGFKNITAYGSM